VKLNFHPRVEARPDPRRLFEVQKDQRGPAARRRRTNAEAGTDHCGMGTLS
jgi:hypothetical protein